METLVDVLKDPTRMRAVVADGARMIEAEVGDKGGLSGMALKGGYKAVKSLKPGIIEEALGTLLPEFAPAIDPHFAKAQAEGNPRAYFTKHADLVADALLGVTDRKRERAKNAVIKKAYDALRGQAKKHTAEAMPRLADLIAKHVNLTP